MDGKGKSNKIQLSFAPWLDVLSILLWGILLLKYWQSKELYLLIHPNYFSLVLITGIILVGLSLQRAVSLVQELGNPTPKDRLEHVTLFSPVVANGILIVVAIAGLVIPPKMLTSDIALQRGVTESLPLTRLETRSFAANNTNPQERSLVDWVRTLNVYPEPDAYNGQKAKITGFVIHVPQLPQNYFLISRFILTCCAVDAYPVGIPVKLNQKTRQDYPPDSWWEIEGEMTTESLPIAGTIGTGTWASQRQLVLSAKSVKTIPTPADPYDY